MSIKYLYDLIVVIIIFFLWFKGREMYHITWVFQYLTLLLGNMGFILLGGRALKVLQIVNDPLSVSVPRIR
jgi:hypothetical protein